MGKESSTKRTKSARNAPLAKPPTATSRKPTPPKTLAKKANGIPTETLQALFDKYLLATSNGQPEKLTWSIYDGPTLGADMTLKSQVWDLFAVNMEKIYMEAKDPDIKWDPREKKDELFGDLSRLVIVRDAQGDVRAFSMFRFEAEKNYYGLRGTGICRRAFTTLESIARELQAQLVMLTCFKCNTHALSIYEHFGYQEHIDTTDTAKVLWKPIKSA
ncbi:GNAT family acetyltransferase, partial [Rhizoctonia solani AG-3 Rhs1AP]